MVSWEERVQEKERNSKEALKKSIVGDKRYDIKDPEIVYGKNLFNICRKLVPGDVICKEHKTIRGLVMIGIKKGKWEIKMIELGEKAPIKYSDLKKVVEIAVQKLDEAIKKES